MNDQTTWETIVRVGGEGGSISLLGAKDEDGNWVFHRKVDEFIFQDLDDDFTEETLQSTSHKTSLWEDAIKLLDVYPWSELSPMEIHPQFKSQIWQELHLRSLSKSTYRKWAKVCCLEVIKLAQLIKSSSYTVVLTGAGMSVESGIPDFRSSSGWWKNIDPRTVAAVEALQNHYSLFHEFYSMRIKGLESCAPHEGHLILADFEQRGLINAIATQNVDGFHRQAGSKNVSELHGSIQSFRCADCQREASQQAFLAKESCLNCGGRLRPNVVLFGEMLPEGAWQKAFESIQRADLVIVIGTSLEVAPVNQLPALARGKAVLINAEDVGGSYYFDLTLKGKAKEILKLTDEMLQLVF